MKVSTSILSINEPVNIAINKLNDSISDYLHLDVMDGKFVYSNTINIMDEALKYNKKPLDIHLMVDDINYFIEKYQSYHPDFITFHIETTNNIEQIITKLKQLNIKVGITCKPDTDINLLKPYLKDVDLILIMSVNPGLGGQKFIAQSTNKIDILNQLRIDNNYNYFISVDGGINDTTIDLVSKTDIVVSGSYITSGEYNDNICKLKGK